MKYSIFLVLFLFLIAACDKKDNSPEEEPRGEHEEYFEGKINGETFEPNGYWSCEDMYGTFYPNGYQDFEGGFLTLTIKNCDSNESLVIGKKSNLHEGVFTSVDTTNNERPWCTFADNDYDFYDENNQSELLRANHRLEITLEVTNIDHIEEHNDYYVEGLLDAVVQDTIIDSTIVISDVKFGYKF